MATVNMAKALQPTHAAQSAQEYPIGDSSWLMKIKYDPAQLQLTVTTKDGNEYVHFMVYPATVDALIQSPSKGSYYAKNIKGKGISSRIIDKTIGRKPKKNAI